MRTILPCVHVEGPDGSGKSTLVAALRERSDLFPVVIGTEGPAKTWQECQERVTRRIAPGTLCDRSSGLVSELVYGPVLRGETIGDESLYWDLLWSILNRVTFVYCRPPEKAMKWTFRDSEPDVFRDQINKRHKAIVKRYDLVFDRIVNEGGKVIWYDFTGMKPEEVIRCVA